MMKVLVALALVSLAAAAPAPQEAVAKIVRNESSMKADGTFSYAWEAEDGTKAEAVGENKAIGENFGVAMTGSYSYTAPSGELIEVQWTADENGFQPVVTTT